MNDTKLGLDHVAIYKMLSLMEIAPKLQLQTFEQGQNTICTKFSQVYIAIVVAGILMQVNTEMLINPRGTTLYK